MRRSEETADEPERRPDLPHLDTIGVKPKAAEKIENGITEHQSDHPPDGRAKDCAEKAQDEEQRGDQNHRDNQFHAAFLSSYSREAFSHAERNSVRYVSLRPRE